MPKPRAIIFDLFFTLIDPLNDEYARKSEYTVLGMGRGEFEALNGIDYDIRASGRIRDPYEVFRHIARGLDLEEALLLRAADARLERIKRALCGVDPKNLAFLGQLRARGIKTCLISNADGMDIRHWESSPLSGALDETIFSCDVGLLKPDPRIYRLALETLGEPPKQCFYVGDGGHGELRGARETGLRTILTTEYITQIWPERIPALRRDADHEVAMLEDTLSIIEP